MAPQQSEISLVKLSIICLSGCDIFVHRNKHFYVFQQLKNKMFTYFHVSYGFTVKGWDYSSIIGKYLDLERTINSYSRVDSSYFLAFEALRTQKIYYITYLKPERHSYIRQPHFFPSGNSDKDPNKGEVHVSMWTVAGHQWGWQWSCARASCHWRPHRWAAAPYIHAHSVTRTVYGWNVNNIANNCQYCLCGVQWLNTEWPYVRGTLVEVGRMHQFSLIWLESRGTLESGSWSTAKTTPTSLRKETWVELTKNCSIGLTLLCWLIQWDFLLLVWWIHSWSREPRANPQAEDWTQRQRQRLRLVSGKGDCKRGRTGRSTCCGVPLQQVFTIRIFICFT